MSFSRVFLARCCISCCPFPSTRASTWLKLAQILRERCGAATAVTWSIQRKRRIVDKGNTTKKFLRNTTGNSKHPPRGHFTAWLACVTEWRGICHGPNLKSISTLHKYFTFVPVSLYIICPISNDSEMFWYTLYTANILERKIILFAFVPYVVLTCTCLEDFTRQNVYSCQIWLRFYCRRCWNKRCLVSIPPGQTWIQDTNHWSGKCLRSRVNGGLKDITILQFPLPHTRGSSHGQSRITRIAYPEPFIR